MNSNTKIDEPIAEVSADETVDWILIYGIIYELLEQSKAAQANINDTESLCTELDKNCVQ
jgi:hypothetical protein